MIERSLKPKLNADLARDKVLVLMGARQVGKTTLIEEITRNHPSVLWLNGDEPDVRNVLGSFTSSRIKAIIGENKILVIDEAQRIEDIGLKLKLIHDNIPDLTIIASGSSSFELANIINEPLTGRKIEHCLFPLSFEELVENHGLLEEKRLLRHRLVYGSYPDVVVNQGREKEILKELSSSYLYKDILAWDYIKKSDKLVRLLQALSLQVGSQVSYTELGQVCGLDYKTVEKYIELLEKAYIVFRLGSFSRNLRNELKKSRKVYFYDNGIRNAIIANFSQVETRDDIGALWENYLISERLKTIEYHSEWVNQWFWRTQSQQEIDLIEEQDGQITAYEFKWNPRAKARMPKSFSNAYPDSKFVVINQDNYEDFLLR